MRNRFVPLSTKCAFTVALGVGVVIRVAYWLSKRNQPLGLNDSLYYSAQAAQLARGEFFREIFVDRPGAEHGPLTSILMAPVSFGADHVRWQRLVTVVCGVALVWLIGRLATRLAGERAGVAATAIAAVSPNLWMNDGLVMSESVSMLLIAAALWFALDGAAELGRRSLLMLGVTLALGALARSEVVLLIPLVLAWLLYCHRRLGRSAVVKLLPMVAAAGLVIAPWVVFNLARFERPVLLTTNDGTTLLGANCPVTYGGTTLGGWSIGCIVDDPLYRMDEEPSVRSERQRSLALQFVRSRIGDLPVVTLARLGRSLDLYGLGELVRQDVGEERPRWASWAGIVSFWLMAVASALGWRHLPRRQRWLLLLPVVVVLCATVIFYGGHRIRASAEPTLVLLTAVSVHHWLAARTQHMT